MSGSRGAGYVFDDDFKARRADFDAYAAAQKFEAFPPELAEAVKYSLNAGGKRIRPLLFLEAYRLIKGGEKTRGAGEAKAADGAAYTAALAIECIHAYSLIHDDLPCMDDDDFRRGKPTSHKRFGEAAAVLAGDCLLNYAYELLIPLAGRGGGFARAAAAVAGACGGGGLIGGQFYDVTKEADADKHIDYIYSRKTGALLTASVAAGAAAAGADGDPLRAFTEYGENFGFAFQLYDDLTEFNAGEGDGKPTYLRLHGVEKTKKELNARAAAAVAALASGGVDSPFLTGLAEFLTGG